MSAGSRSRVLGPVLMALAAAEVGVRVLSPRLPVARPPSVDVKAYFAEHEITRGARFARPQLALALARGAVELAVLGSLARRTPDSSRAASDQASTDRGLATFTDGALAGTKLAIALTAPAFPLSAVSRWRAMSVGLVTQSWRGWGADLAKATGIEAVLAAAGGGAALVAIERYPRGWWAPAAAASVLVGGVFAALAPVVLDPIFNEFTPLPEGVARADVLELARAAGVKVGEVYSVDASRRTTAANAYVTGLGPTKRVVLFDTLLDRYSRDEVRLVVAHELAHVCHRDVQRGVLFAAIVAPAGAFAIQRVSWALSPQRRGSAALPALALAAALVSVPVGMVGNRLSRALERRADAFSLELAGEPAAFVSFERRIALQNVADLDPPRWITALLATHPPTTERIGAAVAFMNRNGAATPL